MIGRRSWDVSLREQVYYIYLYPHESIKEMVTFFSFSTLFSFCSHPSLSIIAEATPHTILLLHQQQQQMEETTSRFKRICVFCGSSSGKKPTYQEAAVQLGRELVIHVICFFSSLFQLIFLRL